MRCPKCNSEHTIIEAKEAKPDFTVALCLVFGGFGLMFFGIGAILGVLVCFIIGKILKAALPVGYQTILVCQSCGYTSRIKKVPDAQCVNSTADGNVNDYNLVISRDNLSVCSIVVMQIKIDNTSIYDLVNGQTIRLKLADGVHKVSYLQKNGMGKKNRCGDFEVVAGSNVKVVKFTLTQNGVNVIQN